MSVRLGVGIGLPGPFYVSASRRIGGHRGGHMGLGTALFVMPFWMTYLMFYALYLVFKLTFWDIPRWAYRTYQRLR